MWDLMKIYRQRKRGDPPFISLSDEMSYAFSDYKKILGIAQTITVLLIVIWCLSSLLSGSFILAVAGIVSSIFIFMEQRKKFIEWRSFFKREFQIDNRLLVFALDNDLRNALFTYVKNDDELIVRIKKDHGPHITLYENLDKSLESLFDLPLVDKKIDPSYVTYYFALTIPERLQVSSTPTDSLEFTNDLNINLGYGVTYNAVKCPHILIAGGTGSGKSVFISFFILELMKQKATLYLADPKNSDLGSLSHYLGDHVAVTSAQIAKVTRLVVEEMQKRYDFMNDLEHFQYGSSFLDHDFKPVWLIFDEMGAFTASGTDKKSKELVAEVMANIKQIILLGRQAGCFILIAAQQMSANTLGGSTELRDNLGLRIALGANSSEGYKMVFGSHVPDTLLDVSVKGSGLLYMQGSGNETAQYYESPYVDMENFNFVDELLKYKVASKYDLA